MVNTNILSKNIILVLILSLIVVVPVSMSLNEGKLVNKVQGRAVVGSPVEWNVSVAGYKVKYETPAPERIEEDLGSKKRVTISSNSSDHYVNVKSSSTLPEISYKPKIYHLIEGERVAINDLPEYNVTFLDTNNNEKYDLVEWNIPHLSEQIFEIELVILNVQSYPIVGKNWTVMFNTSGVADLTIQSTQGTTWSENAEDKDLKFLELGCGNNEVQYQWINNSVFVEDYSGDGQTSYEISKVLTAGSHHIKFQFGDIVKYAHNFANGDACGVTFSNIVHEFKDNEGNDILSIDTEGNMYIGSLSFIEETSPSFKGEGVNIYGSGLQWAFNGETAEISGNIYNGSILPLSVGSNSILFKNTSGSYSSLVFFNSSSGDILVKGQAVYNGSQAGCSADGLGCDTSEGHIKFSDNWCNIANNNCTSTFVGEIVEVCHTCSDTDGGNSDYTHKGTATATDYCVSGDHSCPVSSQTSDNCLSSITLAEKGCNPANNNTLSTSIDCRDYCQDSTNRFTGCDSFQDVCEGTFSCADVAGECVNGSGCSAPENIRYVFVTSEWYEPELEFDGASEADAICQGLADDNGLVGTWKAWLSTNTDAKERVGICSGSPCVNTNDSFYLIDGTKIADSGNDLLDGSLDHDLDVDETGEDGSASNVWTGTNTDGTSHSNRCLNWQTNHFNYDGVEGQSYRDDSSWTFHDTLQDCDTSRSLYCFQYQSE